MPNVFTKIFDLPAKRVLTWLIILLPVSILIYAVITQAGAPVAPKAQKGRLDLSNYDYLKNGNVKLDGEWEFYWQQLLEPKDFGLYSTVKPSGYIKVPGLWNGYELGAESLPGKGYGTFVLVVKLNNYNHLHALKILTMSNAYKLWVNDKLIASNGKVGTDEMSNIPEYRPQVMAFQSSSQDVRIIVQVSNFYHWKGGFWHPIKLGSFENVHQEYNNRILLEMFLLGCLFIMAIYHFGLFSLRRKDPSTLYFGLMCFVISFRSLLIGENLINYIIPDLNWFMARKIEYLLTFVTVPVYMAFTNSLYPKEINRNVYNILMLVGLLLCMFTLFSPIDVYTFSSYIFSPYSWVAAVCAIYVFIVATKREREGAQLFLATSLFFLLTIVNDALNQTEIIHTGLYLPFGLLTVVFAQSYILSSRSANAYRNLEIYSATFQKFVPSQFLNRIAKDGIESIKVGNAEKENVTVLFSDIRSFTAMSENLTPNEIFDLLNEYLAYVEAPIRTNHGFVDKYMGDGIMALFEDRGKLSADHAVCASLQMRDALKRFNQKRSEENKPIIIAGTGIHTGSVIIGTLGGEERMDSTAIGDAVNLTSRIEGMTKTYGVPILASDDTVQSLKEKGKYLIRFVDKALAKGKSQPVAIWEIMGFIHEFSSEITWDWLRRYNVALEYFNKNEKKEAIVHFNECLRIWPNDKVCEMYIAKCKDI